MDVPQSSFSGRLPRIIGRREILDSIEAALADHSGQSYVIYLEAPGGMGKTRILEEVGNFQKQSRGGEFLWGDKIDLYHEKYHSPENLQKAIADGLDSDSTQFKKFRLLQKELEEKQRQGFGGPVIEELRHRVNNQFLEDYKLLTKKERLALCFDTMELTQHESDIVQRICEVENEDTVARNWLLSFVSQIPNTVTIFAGRPQAQIEEKDFDNSKEFLFQKHTIKEFSRDESLQYLDERIKQNQSLTEVLTEDVKEWITQIAEGRPIRLAMCVDLLFVRGYGALPTKAEDIDQELIYKLFIDPETPPIFRYLIVARKGLDEKLFLHLMGGSEQEIKDAFALLYGLEIVKKPEGSTKYFLHDEVYDLADKYFQNEAWFGENYNSIVQYYRKMRDSVAPDARQDVTVELLYYEHQKNAHDGYHKYYARWDEEAIKGHETGFDMRLRDEGLRFMDRYTNPNSPFFTTRVSDTVSRAEIDRDCAVRWVKRYLARGQFEKAIQVAQNVRHNTDPVFNWDTVDDPLYKAGLLTAWAEALTYTGVSENEIHEKLDDVINYLSDGRDWNEDQRWWRARILGRAHDRIGYLHRTRGRYGLALEQYKRALPYYAEANIPDERATTLNNLAFLLALLGRVRLARNHVDQALEIRKNLGRKYPLALSLNTRGLIHVLEDHPMWGERDCRDALRMCEELGDPRGIGLAHMGLGLALRKRGDQWKLDVYTPKEAEGFFRAGEEHLKKAADIFTEAVPEPIRLWEAYNELGSLHCDWGWLTRHRRDRKGPTLINLAIDQYAQSIDYQKQALQVAKDHGLSFQVADSYDDLAQAYADRSFFLRDPGRAAEADESLTTASTYLDEILKMIPREFHLIEDEGFRQAPEQGESYWLSLGKIHLQRGIWLLRNIERGHFSDNEREGHLREGVRHFAISTAYFDRYWPHSHAFNEGLNAFASRLQRAEVSAELARSEVQKVVNDYRVNLDRLLETIDNVLGI